MKKFKDFIDNNLDAIIFGSAILAGIFMIIMSIVMLIDGSNEKMFFCFMMAILSMGVSLLADGRQKHLFEKENKMNRDVSETLGSVMTEVVNTVNNSENDQELLIHMDFKEDSVTDSEAEEVEDDE